MSGFVPKGDVMPEAEKQDNIYVCKKCSKVYGRLYDYSRARLIDEEYYEFPTYGLRRKNCMECSES